MAERNVVRSASELTCIRRRGAAAGNGVLHMRSKKIVTPGRGER
jgi:hypothetical protein